MWPRCCRREGGKTEPSSLKSAVEDLGFPECFFGPYSLFLKKTNRFFPLAKILMMVICALPTNFLSLYEIYIRCFFVSFALG